VNRICSWSNRHHWWARETM